MPDAKMPDIGLPKSLVLLLGTLLEHNGITNWSIYDNKNNGVNLTIRFGDGSHVGELPVHYRRVSSRQAVRNRDRAAKHKQHTVCDIVPSVIQEDSLTPHMDNNISPPVTRSKHRMEKETLRCDHLDNSDANISLEHVDVSMTLDSPVGFIPSPVLFQNSRFEESSTQTISDHSMKCPKTDQSSQTKVIFHPDSKKNIELCDMCEDVWPDQNCVKSKCAYSELYSNVQTSNDDLLKCLICNVVLCKTCRCDSCHDFHGKFAKVIDET